MSTRPDWDEYFRDIVILTAKRSSCHRLNVGCLLIKDNRIISQGYNGHLPGLPHNSIIVNGHEIATIHAEQNALIDCAKRAVSSYNTTAFISHKSSNNTISPETRRPIISNVVSL